MYNGIIMKKTLQKIMSGCSHFANNGKSLFVLLSMLIISSSSIAFAQNRVTVTGSVVDPAKEPIIGASVTLKSDPTVGTTTDLDGKFSLQIPSGNQTMVFTYLGMNKKEVQVHGQRLLSVQMEEDTRVLNEVVVVGYGQQKKESVVGSITQTTGKVLERAGGVSNLGMALTGNLPGVSTLSSTGMPGQEDPQIIIRGISSWNNSEPLVLVDGVERPISSIDISSVASISVLKDASATAVYGVKGANGVILITTKRGVEGHPIVSFKANTTLKAVSRLPEKYDSYDALSIKNTVIERELGLDPTEWAVYTPVDILDKYRNPANDQEWDQYPNVDWQKELFKNYAMSYNANVNISGGTKMVKYFSAIDYVHEGDIFKSFDNGRGYTSGWGYNRLNIRSNLDFKLTNTTQFTTNLFGSNGVQTVPYGYNNSSSFWRAVYRNAPDSFRPVYSDGTYGYYQPRQADQENSVAAMALAGLERRTTTQLTTDFILIQDLDMITKGLSANGRLSLDNTFQEIRRGISDASSTQLEYVNPLTGGKSYANVANTGWGNTGFDYFPTISWAANAGYVNTGATYRKLYYSLQMNYARDFGKHSLTGMGLFSRDKSSKGSAYPDYREDWVFRATYNYASKYFVEINGAYNGSQKFGPTHRFSFFPSFSGGWMLTNENFMKSLRFLDMLKLRASWGKIGDDNVNARFLYSDQWSYGGNTTLGNLGDVTSSTPYTYYSTNSLGNPDISWETVRKQNYGVDYGFFGGFLTGSFDIFSDYRYDVLIAGSSRAIPTYFGVNAPYANLGKVKTHGYELDMKFNYRFSNGIHLWSNVAITHAIDKIIYKDDPELLPDYQKAAGYAINQTTAYLNEGYLTTWDDIYGSTVRTNNNSNKLAGDYNILDINGDGIIDKYDKTPYQYSTNPQNTYSTSVGLDWKGFAVFVQFYGVTNVTRQLDFTNFFVNSNVVYKEGTFWTKGSNGLPLPRWQTLLGEEASGTRYLYDGSYLRLKNAEVSYTFQGGVINNMKMKSCRLYLNGDNLLLWTKMPDDRESNFSTSVASDGAYPTMKRFNLGVEITF
jgi:TonB-linked SusC/RagA family outer membrane protein